MRKDAAVLVVELVDGQEGLVNVEGVVVLEHPRDVVDLDSLILAAAAFPVKEALVQTGQQLTFQLKLQFMLPILLSELFHLLCLQRSANFAGFHFPTRYFLKITIAFKVRFFFID